MMEVLKIWVYLKYTAFQAMMAKVKTKPIADEAAIDQVAKDGVAVIPDFFDEETCERLKAEIDAIVDEKKEVLWVDKEKADHRVYGIEHLSKEIMERFHDDPRLNAIAKRHYKTEFVNFFTLGARLEAKENNLGSGNGWHRDAVYYPQFKAIVYLDDVELKNGPFQYVLGSHTEKDIIDKVKLGAKHNQNRFEHEQVMELIKDHPEKLKSFPAKKGTLVLTETRGLHRGQPIEEGVRYALTNYYFPTYFKLDKLRKKWESHMVTPETK